jgi:tetratricopeptide (TPR) repeat protein
LAWQAIFGYDKAIAQAGTGPCHNEGTMKPSPALAGVVAIVLTVASAPGRGDDTEAIRKQIQDLSETVGEGLIVRRLEVLRKNPEQARQLVRYGAKLAREQAPPLNWTSAQMLAVLARELRETEAGQVLCEFATEKAKALKSDRKLAWARFQHLAMLLEAQQAESAQKLVFDYLFTRPQDDQPDSLSLSEEEDLADLLFECSRHEQTLRPILEAAAQRLQKTPSTETDPAATYLLAHLARYAGQFDVTRQLLQHSLTQVRTALEKRLARLRQEGRNQPDEIFLTLLGKLSTLYVDLLKILFDHGKYEEADKLAREILELPYSNLIAVAKVEAILTGIQARALLGQTEEALKQLQTFLKLAPTDIRLQYLNSWVLVQAGKNEEAIRHLEGLLAETLPDELKDRVRYFLGNLYSELGMPEKAVQLLRLLVEKYPDNSTYQNDLGYIMADNNMELDEAERLIAKALEKEPDNASYVDSMGWVLFRKGKFKEAKEYLLRASRSRQGQHAEIYDHLGDVHWALGEKAEAVAAWNKALSLCDKTVREQKIKAGIEKKLMNAGSPDR